MGSSNGHSKNGSSQFETLRKEESLREYPPPQVILDCANACVGYVERAVGVALDFEPETLSILDHYLKSARELVAEKPEMFPVVTQVVGAYFGEVVRKRHRCWWRCEGADPLEWRIEFEALYLSFYPAQLVHDALKNVAIGPTTENEDSNEAQELFSEFVGTDEAMGQTCWFHLDEEERDYVLPRLNELPPVTEDEYHSTCQWMEVLDIVVEAIQSKHENEDCDERLSPTDYDND